MGRWFTLLPRPQKSIAAGSSSAIAAGPPATAPPPLEEGIVARASAPLDLSSYKCLGAAATVGDYVIFAGGMGPNPPPGEYIGPMLTRDSVDAYDATHTRTRPDVLSVARHDLAAATVGDYALFAGGVSSRYGYETDDVFHATVDAYDTSLTRTTPTELSEKRCRLAAATVGDYALFAGGNGVIEHEERDEEGNIEIEYEYCDFSEVDVYDTALTRITAHNLNTPRRQLAAATVGDHAIFAGGYNEYSGEYESVAEAYSDHLAHYTIGRLSVARARLAAATIGNYALFGGGYGENGYSAAVDVYDAEFTRLTGFALSVARSKLAAATLIGNLPPETKSKDFALFIGGIIPGDVFSSAAVDAYDDSLRMTGSYLSDGVYDHMVGSVGNYVFAAGGITYAEEYNGRRGYLSWLQAFTVNKRTITGG